MLKALGLAGLVARAQVCNAGEGITKSQASEQLRKTTRQESSRSIVEIEWLECDRKSVAH